MQLCSRRFFHTAKCLWTPSTTSAVAVEKAALSKLRKATGYSFSKCKEALQKHENDFKQAEQWLKEQAQAHGWEKATKLQGRSTGQGLISIFSTPTSAIMIEMNCETDFVARNKKFQTLAQKISQGCYQFSNEQHSSSASALLSKIPLTGEELANVPLAESRRVKDEIALSIGEIGENIKTRRAICFKTTEPVLLVGYTHPAPDGISMSAKEVQCSGRYGAIVAFRPTTTAALKRSKSLEALNLIGRQLCQHVVGMNPKEIGSMELPPPPPHVQETSTTSSSSPPGESAPDRVHVAAAAAAEGEEAPLEPAAEIDETILVNQEFLLDPDITVREFLGQHSVEVLDFIRFECGEQIEPTYCQ